MRRLVALAVLTLALAACPGDGPVFVCDAQTNKPCFDGYECHPTTLTCLKKCNGDDDCLASESCDTGLCMPEAASGGDAAGGDAGPTD